MSIWHYHLASIRGIGGGSNHSESEQIQVNNFLSELLAVFTLEDEQIVWTDKSSQTDKSSDVKTGRTNFQTTLSSEFVRLFVGRL